MGWGSAAAGWGWGSDDHLTFGAEVGDEVLDLRVGEGVAEGGHRHAAVVDLVRDLLFVHALADELEVGTFSTADAGGAMAVRAAMGGEELLRRAALRLSLQRRRAASAGWPRP